MTALTEFLFPAPAPRSVGGIVRWWERRRVIYNVVVGLAGSVSLVTVSLIGALPPGGHGMEFSWIPVVGVGVLANLCYLLGPLVETGIEKLSRGQVLPTGPVLYRMGLTFSVGLVLLPTLMATIFWVARIVMAIF